ncbi:MAG: hypothetical protein FD135_4200 [Comamonadaceae bacterium]|nr:MAG: hypothetical protein FD135_4200 [Comamonadaceae bacterium]
MEHPGKQQQRGGTFLGFVAGLVVGLGTALAVAVYVTKVPVSFMNKVGGQTAEKDVSEAQKNKDWDPNAPLHGKNPVKPVGPAETVMPVAAPPASAPVAGKEPTTAKASGKPETKSESKPEAKSEAKPELKPAVTADPLGDLAKSRTAAKDATAEPFSYFIQLGAFRTTEDAEGQRAKLSLAGVETKLSEREQAGRVVYRVRTGPYDTRDSADKAKLKLDAMGLETALVRVQR